MKRLSHILLGMLIPILGASPAFSKGLPGPELLEYASLGLEYLRGEFKGDLTRDLVTTQLALEF